MPNLTITVTASQATRAVAALRAKYLNDPTLTDAELAQRFIKETLKDFVVSYERSKALSEATRAVTVPDF